MELDLAVINGTAYVGGVFKKVDIGIKDEKFAMITEPGCLPKAEKTIDAEGKYVIPGGIDPHVHFRDPTIPGRAKWDSESMLAARGGTTTILEHPVSSPPPYNKDIFLNRFKVVEERGSVVDYAFYGAAGGEFPENIVDLAEAGAIAYKTFLHEPLPGREKEFTGLTMSTDYEVLVGMTEIAKTGLMLASHAENNDIISSLINKFISEGKVDGKYHSLSRPPISEYLEVQKLMTIADATGCALLLAHISTPEAMQMAKEAKAKNKKVFLETCPHYLLKTEEEVVKHKAYGKCNPPLRNQETIDAIWEYVLDGTVDWIGSDHGDDTREENERGNENIFLGISGFQGINLRLPLMINEVVKGERGITLERVVQLCCENPAKCFNIYPQKGVIQPGSDGDLVIFDLHDQMRCEFTPNTKIYDDDILGCKLNYTILRGKVVMDEGVVDPEASGTKHWGKPVWSHMANRKA
ncbi:MAG: dihydroorotase family protein [Bacillota bacterium]|nr:dihydroorotase family protein [Bacillota bacterium]